MDYEHVKKQLGYGIQTESKDNAIKALEQLQAKIAELEAEVERLKRTNSSYANLTKAQESQLTNLRQRLYQLKGADLAIDSERQANCDLTEQLAAEQLNNKLLRDALNQTNFWLEGALQCKEWNWEPDQRECADGCLGYAKEALDKYVAEKMMETYIPVTIDYDDDEEKVKDMQADRDDCLTWAKSNFAKLMAVTKQRDLAVEALKSCGVNDGLNGPTQYFDEDLVERAIKESEGK